MMILELCVEELSHGVLATEFAKGAVAAIVRCENTGRALWSQLMENRQEQLPWEAPLIDIARNHHGSADITVTLGDAFYFQPDQHAYIARKMEITRAGPDDDLEVHPRSFSQREGVFSPHPATLSSCWAIAEKIMSALTPKGTASGDFKVAVQRLKYQPHWADFASLIDMTEHSLGRWGRLGFAVDRNRQCSAGMLSRKGPSDMIGLLMMVPVVGKMITGLNALIARHDEIQKMEPGHRILEKAHCDKRYFSGLCGTRDTIRTEIFADGKWVELPVNLDCIAVFPGELAARDFGLRPTLHRVIHTGDGPDDTLGDARSRNVTILLGTT